MHKVLVVDDDKVLQQSIKQALNFHHFQVDVADNGREAVSATYRENYELVLMDVNMPGMNGLEALVEIKRNNPAIIVIMLTAYSNVSDAVKAVKEGAYNYLEKPLSTDNLVALIKRALRAKSLVETTMLSAPTLSLGEKSAADQFVGESGPMKKVFNLISKLSKVSTPVLIRGESGTGKELVAKAIHFNGPRKDQKFVTINCGAIPENLIESELFGHEKGAFTGASERKIGKFQFADGGTIFLDEIGDISPSMQVKLLRVLQEKTFTPIGSNREISVDVRVIAASHRHFEEMIKQGTFRDDLFYRLNVLPVYLPPLRERNTDIPHLIDYYIKYFNNIHHLNITGVSEEAKDLLVNYAWPGNIRELRNVIEHAFIIESSDEIHVSSLPDSLSKNSKSQKMENNNFIDFENLQDSVLDNHFHFDHHHLDQHHYQDQGEASGSGREGAAATPFSEEYLFKFGPRLIEGEQRLDFQETKDLFEKEFIERALKLNRGRINQTALKANIPKKTLLRKIEKYGIRAKDFYQKNDNL